MVISKRVVTRIPDITPVDIPSFCPNVSAVAGANVGGSLVGGMVRAATVSHICPVKPGSQEHCILVVHLYNKANQRVTLQSTQHIYLEFNV